MLNPCCSHKLIWTWSLTEHTTFVWVVGLYTFRTLSYTFTWIYTSGGQLDVLYEISGFVELSVWFYFESLVSFCSQMGSNFFLCLFLHRFWWTSPIRWSFIKRAMQQEALKCWSVTRSSSFIDLITTSANSPVAITTKSPCNPAPFTQLAQICST